MKFISKLLFTLLSITLLSSCGSESEPEPVITPEKAKRTVLVYMVARNSLGTGGYDASDLKEMDMAAAAVNAAGGRLLVYHAKDNESPKLMEIKPEGNEILKVYDDSDYSVSAARMSAVLHDAFEFAPADSKGIILWSHADGWLNDGIDEGGASLKGFGYEQGKKMRLTTLAETLKGRGLDFVYFDCCYMGSVEVAYEMRDVAPVIAASPAEVPADGMPYNKTLPYFFTAGKADLVGAASTTFESYNSLSGSSRTCTLAVYDTSALKRLAVATAAVYKVSGGETEEDYEPQRYMTEATCYYYDLAHHVHAQCAPESLKADFDAALADVVMYEQATPRLWDRLDIKYHCGLSTFIISEEQGPETKNYNLNQWYRDVTIFTDKTL
ncbi:MAG: hypothetical protein K2M79_03525 [Muribaculaceae bacterium]|nr:hypothetical protein [Muribaculaceae bacterium]